MNEQAYRALRESAALLDLTPRGLLAVTGDDRVRLMHALTTNHVQQMAEGGGLYAFFLNGQGRIQADLHLYAASDRLWIDVDKSVREKVYAHIDHYIIADDVTLEDESDARFALQVEGPEADAAMQRAGLPVPATMFAEHEGLLLARVSLVGGAGWRIFGPLAEREAWIERLGLSVAGLDDSAVTRIRIENRQPWFGVDFNDRHIPQETGLLRALHFSKGCYLGQEIVERVRSRGHLNKRLAAFRIDGEASPESKLFREGQEAGYLTSVAEAERGMEAGTVTGTVALGWVRTEQVQNNTSLRLESGAEVTFTGFIE
jgi:aminomethyltransferase